MEAVILVLAISWAVTFYFKEARHVKNRLKNRRHVIFIR